jgi:excisionase family DNA binding protein
MMAGRTREEHTEPARAGRPRRSAKPTVSRLHPDDLAALAALLAEAVAKGASNGASGPKQEVFAGQEWISLSAAAKYLGVSRHNLMSRVHEGAFRHMMCGDVWRIHTASFLSWVAKAGSLNRPDRPTTRAQKRRHLGASHLDEVLA